MVQVASEPFGGTDLKPESSGNTQALNIAEDQHFLRKKRIAVRVGLRGKLSAKELMLLNCDVGEDS